MSSLQSVTQTLAIKCGEAAWADYWLSETIPLVQALSETEWQELRAMWPSQEEQWQARLAQMMEFGPPTVVSTLLVEMLLTSSPLVSVHATATLKALGMKDIPNKPDVADRLLELADLVDSQIDKSIIMDYLHMID